MKRWACAADKLAFWLNTQMMPVKQNIQVPSWTLQNTSKYITALTKWF